MTVEERNEAALIRMQSDIRAIRRAMLALLRVTKIVHIGKHPRDIELAIRGLERRDKENL